MRTIILVLLLLVISQTAYADNVSRANILRLSCDMQMDTRNRSPFHNDYTVNFDAQIVSGYKAQISTNTILFQTHQADGDKITTVISRISGDISITSSTLGLLGTGICVKAGAPNST